MINRGKNMNNARKIAANIVENVLERHAFSNICLNRELKECDLSSLDKALVTEIVYGTIKYKYTIDIILNGFLKNGIDSLNKQILNLLRISIYQLKYLDRVPEFAVVNEAVNIAKKRSLNEGKLVNGVLRNFIRNKSKVFYNKENRTEELAFNYSFPKWIVQKMLKQYGETLGEKILIGLNKTPDVTVRVNSLRLSYDEAWNKLEELQYTISKGAISSGAIKILKGSGIEENPLFKAGDIMVQDESAMMVAPLMDLQENMIVMDLCSAPGGKTIHIGELLNNTGNVYAFDMSEKKIQLIRENITRLGVTNIEVNIADARVFDEKYHCVADRVLIDVPCSGFGIIRKKPEIKWTKNKKDIDGLINIQRDIMSNAAKYVKVKGKLIYSTCTLNKEENENNIKWFLKNNSNYELEKIFIENRENLVYNNERCLTILPDENMDGFFIAKMKRLR